MKLILLLLFFSCSKEFELKKTKGLYQIDKFEVGLTDVSEIKWRVGRKRDKKMSQGFIFQVEIPKISRESARKLFADYEVDSWIYKIVKVSRGAKRVLGYVEYKINNTFTSTVRFSIKVLYHAASISDSFRRFHCPAFKHRKKIADYELSDLKLRRRRLYTRSMQKARGRIERPSFAPIMFSGGRDLKGQYVISVALFNSETKRIYGEFVPLTSFIDIQREINVDLPSCIGIKEEINPLPESRSPTLKDLKFN